MPHLVLEYSSNIIEKNNMQDLFKQCHEILAETLPAEIDGCKSRAMEFSHYYIGKGSPQNAFIHANLKLLPGRDVEKVQLAGKKISSLLKNYFSDTGKQFALQITLEISELQKYIKLTS